MNDLQFIKNAEITLLSSYLNDYTLLEASTFKEDFIYFKENKEIFKAMQSLLKKELPIDEDFILKEIKAKGDYQSKLIEILTTTAISDVKKIEDELLEQYKKRELYKFLNLSISKISETTSDKLITQLTSYTLNDSLTDSFWSFENFADITPKSPEFYISEICPIQKKEINLITSRGGKGKSFVALYLMSELAKNGLNCFGWLSEDSVNGSKNRFETLKYTHKHLTPNFKVWGKDKKLESFIKVDKTGNYEASDFFLSFKKAMKPFDLIVIDPLVPLFCKEENNNVEARFLMGLLNEWIEKENKTLILIHHDGKGENAGSRGASAIIDAVRIHYSLETVDNNTTHRKLVLKKSNHFFSNKNEFLIQLFKNEIKPTEIVFEDDKIEKPKNFDTGGIEILFDDEDVPNEKNNKLIDNLKEKGFKFDD